MLRGTTQPLFLSPNDDEELVTLQNQTRAFITTQEGIVSEMEKEHTFISGMMGYLSYCYKGVYDVSKTITRMEMCKRRIQLAGYWLRVYEDAHKNLTAIKKKKKSANEQVVIDMEDQDSLEEGFSKKKSSAMIYLTNMFRNSEVAIRSYSERNDTDRPYDPYNVSERMLLKDSKREIVMAQEVNDLEEEERDYMNEIQSNLKVLENSRNGDPLKDIRPFIQMPMRPSTTGLIGRHAEQFVLPNTPIGFRGTEEEQPEEEESDTTELAQKTE